MNKNRIRDYGIRIGQMPTGAKNAITDVPGVRVGHVTLNKGNLRTGVTAILPHSRNLFKEKVIGAAHVINGFGKTIGTVQINELGTIETPIVLTNTLSVGTAADALIEWALEHNPEIGKTTGTVNPVVGECNDMLLNDIRAKGVQKEHVLQAIENADETFKEGGVGAGTGMVSFGIKGGIGTSSRIMSFSFGSYTMGVLVLSNFGRLDDFLLAGERVGDRIKTYFTGSDYKEESGPEKGSIMIMAGTDLPVTHRQLMRIIKRASVGIARTGSFYGNGSGDIVIGFSTANPIRHGQKGMLQQLSCIPDDEIDLAFHAIAEATEEAVLNALVAAESMTSYDGKVVYSLRDWLESEGTLKL
ncbi:MAG: P1 family peptidase [Tuberibacillus sp.]